MPVSLSYETTDFNGKELVQGITLKKLQEAFGKEATKVPSSCVTEIDGAVTTLRESGTQTCIKVKMIGTAAAWIFVRYSHDPADANKVAAAAPTPAPVAAAAPVVEAPKKVEEKASTEEKVIPATAWGVVKKKKPQQQDDDDDNNAAPAAAPQKQPEPVMASQPPPQLSQQPPPQLSQPLLQQSVSSNFGSVSPGGYPPISLQQSASLYNQPTPSLSSMPLGGGGGISPTMFVTGMNPVTDMTSYDVGKWLMKNGLARYGDNFEYAQVDGKALLMLRVWSAADTKGFMQFCKDDLAIMKAGQILQFMWCLHNTL